MSEALYRKYRPQTFEDVVGQTHIERTLKNAIESDKVSHAYLFCGPRGTGKTTTARLLAKALLCDDGPTPSPDGTCEQCLAIAEGTHPDVNEMDAASRTGVENVREEIIGRVQYAPTRGRYKIYIIDEVHMLSPAAFNALLKTLEEPPDHVVFILCTTDPQMVPETIHSRCQRFDFHRLSNEEIVSRLGAVCMAEDVRFEGDALDLIAHRAQGGMRDALTALEQLIAFGNGAVTMDVARSVLGSLDTDDMATIVDAIASRDAAACFVWVSEYIETGADLAQFTRDLAAYVRDLYVLELTDGAVVVDAPASSRDAMAGEARRFGPDRLAYILRVLGDLNTELRSSTNARLSFEIALTRMVRPESDLTLESLAARIEALESRPQVVASPVEQGAAFSANRAPVGSDSVRIPSEDSVRIANLAQDAGAAWEGVLPNRPVAAVPPSSTGYKPLASDAPRPSTPSPEAATAAMDKAAAFRAQMARRRAEAQARSGIDAGAQSVPAFGPAGSAAPRSPQASEMSSPSEAVSASGASAVQSASGPSFRTSSTANAPVQAPSSSGSSAADGIRAKLLNPAALQRGWQATLAELKRQRAVYAALMQSARVVADADGGGVAIEFSKENDFAYSAAQKPDVSAALDAALRHAFGDSVPFRFTQGGGMAAAVKAASRETRRPDASGSSAEAAVSAPVPPRPSSRFDAKGPESFASSSAKAPAQTGGYGGQGADAASTTVAAPASSAFDRAADDSTFASSRGGRSAEDLQIPEPDDVVPYSDADIASYIDGDPYGDNPYGGDYSYGGDSHAADQLGRAPYAAESNDENETGQSYREKNSSGGAAASYDLEVKGPAPVDPYPVGKSLGFDSMPPSKKRSKGTVPAKGWPGVGSASDAAVAPVAAVESNGLADGGPHAGASAVPTTSTSSNASPAPVHANSAQGGDACVSESFVPFDPNAAVDPNKPNPFAGRRMPSGIGGGSPFPDSSPSRAADKGDMGIADIFGAFGVSMDDVREE